MSTTTLPKQRMKVDEFLVWSERQPDDRYELVDGEIVAMTSDSVRHNRTKAAVWRAFDDAVQAASLPCLVLVDGVGVPINNETLRISDVLVQCGPEPSPDALVIEAPLIVVEVVSPSSEQDDINSKALDYFSVGSIRHYLIVFSQKRAIIHHRRDEAGEITTHITREGDIVLDPPGIRVAVAALLGRPFAGFEETRQ